MNLNTVLPLRIGKNFSVTVSTLPRCFCWRNRDKLLWIARPATAQNNAAEDHPRGHVAGQKRLRSGDDKIEFGFPIWLQGFLVLSNDPSCGLANHFSVLIQQKANGAGRLNLVRQLILHIELHDDLLAGDFRRRDRDGKLSMCSQAKPEA